MEKESVFEHLAKRFSEHQAEIKRGKTLSDRDISEVMFTAGKALFAAISSNEIDLGDTPDWFAIEPKGTRTVYDGNEYVYYSWDLYWLYTTKWLAKNRPTSGITNPSHIRCVNPEKHLYQGLYLSDFFEGVCGIPPYGDMRAWRQLARASEDTCLYLAHIAVKEAEGKRRGPKKKYTVEQLKKVQASYERHYDEMGDSKASWNKAATDHSIRSGDAAKNACRRYLN